MDGLRAQAEEAEELEVIRVVAVVVVAVGVAVAAAAAAVVVEEGGRHETARRPGYVCASEGGKQRGYMATRGLGEGGAVR